MYNTKITKLSLALITALSLTQNVNADDASEIETLKKEIAELRQITKSLLKSNEKIAVLEETQQVLVEETSNLQTGFNYTTVDTTKSHSGLGNAASKVYYSSSPLSIGGYGEMYYSRASGDSGDKETLDVYRFVPYIGYKFTDNIILNTEIEFEHGGVDHNGNGGEVILEFMYLDFLANKNYNFRVGHMLMPMGLINEKHEPTLFTTVQRPDTSKYLLPSTWHESGLMVYGEFLDDLDYKVAVVTSLDATQTDATKWVRNARGGSYKRSGDVDSGIVARLDYTGVNGLLIGTSVYTDKNFNIADIHLDYHNSGARVYGTYANAKRSQGTLAATNAQQGNGGFINISYDVLSSDVSLPIFVQYESYNMGDKNFDGTSGDATKITTLGFNYFPHEQVVLKLDHAMKEKANVKDDITSISMGFIF